LGAKIPKAETRAWPRLMLSEPGLPDGIFSNQKSKFGSILEGIAMEAVGIFHGHVVYFKAVWYICWPFGIFYIGIWYIFPVLVCCTKKNLATLI
jgi:hypothetical protein